MGEVLPTNLALHSHPPGDDCAPEDKDIIVGPTMETEESLDALIIELEEEDGKEADPEVLTIGPGGDRPIPPSLLQTDPSQGLSESEVISSRRKYGWNKMKEERRSNLVKFLMLFVGPVQAVMEVGRSPNELHTINPTGVKSLTLPLT